MTKLTYAQQLAHPLWQRRRLEMLQAANWACTSCGNDNEQLHVHHRQYFKGRMAWEYSDLELAVLCNSCHGTEHYDDEQLKRLLSLVPLGMCPTFNALSLLAGFFGTDVEAVTNLAGEIGVDMRLGAIGHMAARLRAVPDDRLGEVLDLIDAITDEGKSNG